MNHVIVEEGKANDAVCRRAKEKFQEIIRLPGVEIFAGKRSIYAESQEKTFKIKRRQEANAL